MPKLGLFITLQPEIFLFSLVSAVFLTLLASLACERFFPSWRYKNYALWGLCLLVLCLENAILSQFWNLAFWRLDFIVSLPASRA